MTKEQQNQIIADYLRFTSNATENATDEEVIATYGGEDSNEILCSFPNGYELYRAITSTPTGKITFYTLIDLRDMNDSLSTEIHEPNN
jgi:hypothetical protein